MSSDTIRRPRVWLAALALIAALGIAALRVTTLSDVGGVRLSADWALTDFRSNIYYPVRALADGVNPYDRASYRARYPDAETFPPFLPSTLLLHLPFGLLPLALAELAYVAFSIGLIVLVGRAVVRANGVTSWVSALFAAALVTLSRPGQWTLLLGQVALQAALLSWVALRFAQRAPWLSGLALGAATFKPTFGLPIAVLMLARGNVKAVGAGVLFALALNLPIAAILEHRTGALQLFVQDLASPYHSWTGRSDSSPRWSFYRIDLVATVGRTAGRSLPHGVETVITILVLAVAALLIRRMRGSESTPGYQPLTEAIICIATLLCVHHLGYDLLLLALPLAALVYRHTPGLLENAAVRLGTLWVFALMAANYLSTQSVSDRLEPGAPLWFALASANSLALLLIFAIYGLTVLRWSSARVAPALDDPSSGQLLGQRAIGVVRARDGS
ncbi:MAG TPA: glycosyltransferase family 87 protein [Gemmatimonadaceae bacterium]